MRVELHTVLSEAELNRLKQAAPDPAATRRLVGRIIRNWLNDKRRSHQDLIPRSMRWPEDWWRRMIKMWKSGNVQYNVRRIVRDRIVELDPDADDYLTPLPPEIDRTRKQEPQESSYPISFYWPADWYEWMQDNCDEHGIARFIKETVLPHIDTKRTKLSKLRGRGERTGN